MKHTTRMLMIPEDVYQALMLQSSSAVIPRQKSSAIDQATHIVNSTTPIVHTAERMTGVSSGDVGRAMNDAERLIHYQQEFKRYQKLLADERERPVNVHVENLPAAAEQLRNALAGVRPAITPQQQPKIPTAFTTPSSAKPIVKRNVFEEEDEDDENENEADKTLVEETPPESGRSTMPFASIESAQHHISKMLNYMESNPGNLGLGGEEGTQVCRLMKGEYRPVKNSNINEILYYHFVGKYEDGAKKPAGYQTFMGNAKSDIKVLRFLSPESKFGSGYKKGVISAYGNTKKQQQSTKISKKAIVKNKITNWRNNVKNKSSEGIFCFRPKLW